MDSTDTVQPDGDWNSSTRTHRHTYTLWVTMTWNDSTPAHTVSWLNTGRVFWGCTYHLTESSSVQTHRKCRQVEIFYICDVHDTLMWGIYQTVSSTFLKKYVFFLHTQRQEKEGWSKYFWVCHSFTLLLFNFSSSRIFQSWVLSRSNYVPWLPGFPAPRH